MRREKERMSERSPGVPLSRSVLPPPTRHTLTVYRARSLHLSVQVTEKLLDLENETMMKVADLEKIVLQKDKELHVMRVSGCELWSAMSYRLLSISPAWAA